MCRWAGQRKRQQEGFHMLGTVCIPQFSDPISKHCAVCEVGGSAICRTAAVPPCQAGSVCVHNCPVKASLCQKQNNLPNAILLKANLLKAIHGMADLSKNLSN